MLARVVRGIAVFRLIAGSPYGKVRIKEFETLASATVTSKGQITIPAKVRQALQVEPGDRVEFVEVGSGRFEVVAVTHSVTELKRMFDKAMKRVSIEDMNKAIAARGAAAR